MAYDNSLATPVAGTTISVSTFGGKVVTNIQAVAQRERTIEVFGPTTDIATGDGKKYLPITEILNNYNVIAVYAEVITAGTTGTTDIQIARIRGGTPVDILSTKLTIDSGETSSRTAATPVVINTANDDLATGDKLRIDVDAKSTTAPKGLIISFVCAPI